MKTAEYWLHVDKFPATDGAYANEEFTAWIEAIQLDALQEAARVVSEVLPKERGNMSYEDFIKMNRILFKQPVLSLANTLTNGGEGK